MFKYYTIPQLADKAEKLGLKMTSYGEFTDHNGVKHELLNTSESNYQYRVALEQEIEHLKQKNKLIKKWVKK